MRRLTRCLIMVLGIVCLVAVSVHGAPVDGSGSSYGVLGENTGVTSWTKLGMTGYGAYARNEESGARGVFAVASSATGNTIGVYGWVNSTSGVGVAGYASAASAPSARGDPAARTRPGRLPRTPRADHSTEEITRRTEGLRPAGHSFDNPKSTKYPFLWALDMPANRS